MKQIRVRDMIPIEKPIDIFIFMFRFSGPIVSISIVCLIIFIKSYYKIWRLEDLLIIGTFVFFRSFVEWSFHRYLLHTAKLPWIGIRIENSIARMHMKHHREPSNIDILLFGGVGMFCFALFVFVLFLAVSQSFGLSLTICLSSVLLMMIYEWFHLACHSTVNFNSKAMQRIMANHKHHHSGDAKRHFSVSSVWGDRFLETYFVRGGDSENSGK